MSFLSLKKFSGHGLTDALNYLRVDLSKAFTDLTTVLDKAFLQDLYVEAVTPTATDFTATTTETDILVLRLGAGAWNVFGSVLMRPSGGAVAPAGIAWIGEHPASFDGTTFAQSRVEQQISVVTDYAQLSVFRRFEVSSPRNVILGGMGFFTGGVMSYYGAIWAIGRN